MDRDLLKKFIKDSVFTQEDIAELAGIPSQTWYWRLRNNKFMVSDLISVIDLLDLSNEQILKLLGR